MENMFNRKAFLKQLEEDEREAAQQEEGGCGMTVEEIVEYWSTKTKQEIQEYFGDRYDAELNSKEDK